MATARRAFGGSTPGVLLEAILTRTPPAPSLLNPDLPPAFFRADHPFLFMIRDQRSGSILFIGRMTNPKL